MKSNISVPAQSGKGSIPYCIFLGVSSHGTSSKGALLGHFYKVLMPPNMALTT